MAGLSVRTIQRIENGERPGLETLSALAAVFEVTVAGSAAKPRGRRAGPGSLAGSAYREAKARVQQESRFVRCGGAGGLRAAGAAQPATRSTLVRLGRLIWGALLAVRGLRLFVFGEWIKTGARRACSGCCVNSKTGERRRSVQIVTGARTPSVSISPPLPCWTMAPRDITGVVPARRQSHRTAPPAGWPYPRGSPADGSPRQSL
ncbi:hypothetical protein BANRA_05471 [Klebsiella variicola]|nr:hypothetical protein BANRA_05471 [Klebsiella variicola]